MRLDAIGGELCVQRSELRGDLKVQWNERASLSLARLLWQSRKGCSGSGILLRADQILYPTYLPVAKILLSVLALQAIQLAGCSLFQFENALIDRRTVRKRNPRSICDVDQNARRIVRRLRTDPVATMVAAAGSPEAAYAECSNAFER